MGKIQNIFKRIFRVLPPTIIYVFAGLVCIGMTKFNFDILGAVSPSQIERLIVLNVTWVMWLVYITAISLHYTYWTDLDDYQDIAKSTGVKDASTK
jgi:hypothetical protein